MKRIGLCVDRENFGDFSMWNFYRNIQVNDANISVTAGVNALPLDGSKPGKKACLCLHARGPHVDIERSKSGNGFILLCHDSAGTEALKEAIAHLYRVIVLGKIDIRDLESIPDIKEEGGNDHD